MTCPIAGTLAIVGEKWTLLILRDIARGKTKFSEIHDSLGCPKNLLSTRLKTLESAGILYTSEYIEPGSRPRLAYYLTETGMQLMPVLLALQEWGMRYLDAKHLVQTQIIHTDCGEEVHYSLECTKGHHIAVEDIEIQLG